MNKKVLLIAVISIVFLFAAIKISMSDMYKAAVSTTPDPGSNVSTTNKTGDNNETIDNTGSSPENNHKQTNPKLVAYDGPVENIFFHPLIAYPELAFDGDNISKGYDEWFITVSEFKKSLRHFTEITSYWWT